MPTRAKYCEPTPRDHRALQRREPRTQRACSPRPSHAVAVVASPSVVGLIAGSLGTSRDHSARALGRPTPTTGRARRAVHASRTVLFAHVDATHRSISSRSRASAPAAGSARSCSCRRRRWSRCRRSTPRRSSTCRGSVELDLLATDGLERARASTSSELLLARRRRASTALLAPAGTLRVALRALGAGRRRRGHARVHAGPGHDHRRRRHPPAHRADQRWRARAPRRGAGRAARLVRAPADRLGRPRRPSGSRAAAHALVALAHADGELRHPARRRAEQRHASPATSCRSPRPTS